MGRFPGIPRGRDLKPTDCQVLRENENMQLGGCRLDQCARTPLFVKLKGTDDSGWRVFPNYTRIWETGLASNAGELLDSQWTGKSKAAKMIAVRQRDGNYLSPYISRFSRLGGHMPG